MSSDENDQDMEAGDDSGVSLQLRAMVTGPEAGSIIGRKGENVKNMREETKAKIMIEGDGPVERIVSVEGKTDSIFKAFTMICKVLEQRENKDRDKRESDEPEELCLVLLVPASQCGALIGKEGAQIKELRANTGADIHISADAIGNSSEREMKLKGKREQITKCIFHVCSVLMENPPKGQVRLYKPDSVRDRERDRERERERDYRMRDRDYRDSYQRDREYDMYPRRETPPRYSMGTPFDAILDFARNHGGSGRSRETTKYEMYVSNDQVGAIIGRKGSKINEIRDMSGASINILETGSKSRDRRDGPSDPERQRIIEISGSPEQVAVAKSLINVAMDLRDRSDRARDESRRRDRTRSRSRDRASRYDDRRRW